MNDFIETTTSYLVGLGAFLSTNVDSFLTYGGAILLIVRLTADAPRAWKNIRKLFGDN